MKRAPASHTQILLIDDNRDGLLVRRLLLQEIGFDVEVAATGEEGLNLCANGRFDVVVTDYRMPKMNGTDFIERLRKLDGKVRVILLSGFVEPLGLTEENTGADAVIAKTSNEVAHLTHWVKRLANQPHRKPAASQKRFGGGASDASVR
ncbi:MAG: response regulator [Acidobacteriia bacterium]|nr:response regulator [Terriglobia bacterium]